MDNVSQPNVGCASGDAEWIHLLQYQTDLKEQAPLKNAAQETGYPPCRCSTEGRRYHKNGDWCYLSDAEPWLPTIDKITCSLKINGNFHEYTEKWGYCDFIAEGGCPTRYATGEECTNGEDCVVGLCNDMGHCMCNDGWQFEAKCLDGYHCFEGLCEACADKDDDCSQWTSHCNHGRWKDWMKVNCPETCEVEGCS